MSNLSLILHLFPQIPAPRRLVIIFMIHWARPLSQTRVTSAQWWVSYLHKLDRLTSKTFFRLVENGQWLQHTACTTKQQTGLWRQPCFQSCWAFLTKRNKRNRESKFNETLSNAQHWVTRPCLETIFATKMVLLAVLRPISRHKCHTLMHNRPRCCLL